MTRVCTNTVFPELLPPSKREKGDWRDLDVISENVGLRPTRHGGVRIEKDSLGVFLCIGS